MFHYPHIARVVYFLKKNNIKINHIINYVLPWHKSKNCIHEPPDVSTKGINKTTQI